MTKIKGSMVMGVEIHSGAASSGYWTYTILKQDRKKLIKIVKQKYFKGAFDIEKFTGMKFDKKIPVLLNITGINVLIEEEKQDTLPADFLMGMPEDELYINKYMAKNTGFITATYHKQVNEYVDGFYDNGFFVWDVALSSLPVLSLSSILRTSGPDSISIEYSDVSVNGNSATITNPEYPEALLQALQVPCHVGDEATNLIHLPALASALSFYVNNESISDAVENCRKEYFAATLTRKLIFGTLGLVFIALLVNVLMFQRYNSSYTAIQTEINLQQQQKEQINQLGKSIAQKEGILQQVIPSHNVPLSYLADQFAACVPQNVRLNSLEIDPVEGKIKEGKPIVFRRGIIRAEGLCDFPEDFANLLENLSKKEWVAKINKKEYKSTVEGGLFIVEVSYGG